MIVSSWCWCSAWNSCHSVCCCSISLSSGMLAGRRFPLLTEFLILVWCGGMQTRSPPGACVGGEARLKLQASSAAATTDLARNVHLLGERGEGNYNWLYGKLLLVQLRLLWLLRGWWELLCHCFGISVFPTSVSFPLLCLSALVRDEHHLTGRPLSSWCLLHQVTMPCDRQQG